MKFLIIFLTLIGLAVAGVFQHELIRVESRKTKMIKEGTWEAYIEAKQLAMNPKSSKSISQIINDFRDCVYMANITVGTPEQQFLVVLDTGSADFWIPDSTCGKNSVFNDDEICQMKHQFDSDNSSTYIKTAGKWKIRYGTGSASGFEGQDTVGLGGIGEEKLVVPKTAIGQATQLGDFFAQTNNDGMLGLAFPSIDEAKVDPVLFNAMKLGLLDKPIFTIYLQEHGSEVNVPGGAITYGGFDTEHCSSEIDYVPLTDETFYQYKLDSLSFGNYSASDGWQAFSDTGCTANLFPPDVYNGLTQNLDIDEQGNIDCNATIPDLKLTINGKDYTIPSKQLILHGDNETCGIAFDIAPFFILGDPFIRSYCNVFHLQDKKIGFAKVIS